MEKNIISDVRAIVNTSIENKLNETSELKCEQPILGINMYAEKNRQDTKEYMANNAQAIVKVNTPNEQSQFERSLLEYERMIPIEDCPRFMYGNYVEMLTRIVRKTAYILHWLDGVNKAIDTKSIQISISEQPRISSTQSSNCNKDIRSRGTLHKQNSSMFRTRNKREKNYGDYNEASSIDNVIPYMFIFTKNSCLEGRYVRHTIWHFYTILQKWDFKPTSSGKSKYRKLDTMKKNYKMCFIIFF